jgi:hypothetical protein
MEEGLIKKAGRAVSRLTSNGKDDDDGLDMGDGR